MALALLLVTLVALSIGSVPIPFTTVLAAMTGGDQVSPTEQAIIMEIRLPRVFLAIIVGAGLSVAGAVLQALLRNPLAEPYILGISSGGSMGAILAIALLTGTAPYIVPIASFAGSSIVLVVVFAVAYRRGQLDPYTLLLSGVMVGAFFNAAILLTIAVFNQELRNAFLWLMGNLSAASMDAVLLVGPLLILGSAGAMMLSRQFNIIATGDDSALQLGVDVRALRRKSYLIASFLTGIVVSVSGVVGFVGLIVPHVCRMVFGPDHRLLLPASFLLGGTFLVLADLLARTVLAPAEIPVGAVTAAIGAPVFIYLLRRT
jgi:iron complex transport system permease protein